MQNRCLAYEAVISIIRYCIVGLVVTPRAGAHHSCGMRVCSCSVLCGSPTLQHESVCGSHDVRSVYVEVSVSKHFSLVISCVVCLRYHSDMLRASFRRIGVCTLCNEDDIVSLSPVVEQSAAIDHVPRRYSSVGIAIAVSCLSVMCIHTELGRLQNR